MKKGLMKLCGLALSLALMLVTASTFVACGHEHTFASEWKSDATNHWHAATCEHTDETEGKAAHTFSGDTCSVCGYKKAHEHTFATTWSSDETNHWHAATCAHTDEKKDNAAHTFDGNKCSVCDYTKELKCKCEEPCKICPDCGGCIEADCKDESCIKCGEGLTSHVYLAVDAKLKPGRNPNNPDELWGLDTVDHSNCSHELIRSQGNAWVIQGVKGNNGGSMTWEIESDKETVFTFRINSAKSSTKPRFTDEMLVMINDDIIESDAETGARNNAIKSSKEDYGWFTVGCFKLKEGKNTIIIGSLSGDLSVGYNMCAIDVMTPEGVTLTFTPSERFDIITCTD